MRGNNRLEWIVSASDLGTTYEGIHKGVMD
jgi:hypothetical protein